MKKSIWFNGEMVIRNMRRANCSAISISSFSSGCVCPGSANIKSILTLLNNLTARFAAS